MPGADGLVSILAGSAISEYSAHQSRYRFHGRIYWSVCVRRVRGASADIAPGICAGCFCALPRHLRGAGSNDREKPGARSAGKVRRIAVVEARAAKSNDRDQQVADAQKTSNRLE